MVGTCGARFYTQLPIRSIKPGSLVESEFIPGTAPVQANTRGDELGSILT